MGQLNARYPGPGRLGTNGGGFDTARPSAPVLIWTSDDTVNPPIFSAIFDGTHVWSAGEIDASNFDRIELEIDQDAAFGTPDEDTTNDIDAAELLAGEVQLTTGSQTTGVALYARARHIHYVSGVPHPSPWSNVPTKTLTGNAVLRTDGSYVLRTDGSKILRAA